MKISVIIPAQNQEKYLERCLESINNACENYNDEVEVIVIINKGEDNIETIAENSGAKIIKEDIINSSKVKNLGIQASSGEIIFIIDPDIQVAYNIFTEIRKALRSNKYIGGGVDVKYARNSFAIKATKVITSIPSYFSSLYAGITWFYKHDCISIGGFNEKLNLGEDQDFINKLKKYGQKRNLKYIILNGSYIVTSCRKFDYFGDWTTLFMVVFKSKKLNTHSNFKNSKIIDDFYNDFDNKK